MAVASAAGVVASLWTLRRDLPRLGQPGLRSWPVSRRGGCRGVRRLGEAFAPSFRAVSGEGDRGTDGRTRS